MIITRKLAFGCALFIAAVITPPVFAEDDRAAGEIPGSIEKISFGDHWAGAEVKKDPQILRGKVVLLYLGDGSPASMEATPGVIEMAKRFRKEPLHVIASFGQEEHKEGVLKILEAQGWKQEMDRVSVMQETRFEGEVEVPALPYYFLFDHTGRLRFHHTAGARQEGNGDKCQEQLAALLKEVPPDAPAKGIQVGDLSNLRVWSNQNGRTIEASLVSVGEDLAKFRMRDGRIFSYRLDRLSGPSLDEVKKLAGK